MLILSHKSSTSKSFENLHSYVVPRADCRRHLINSGMKLLGSYHARIGDSSLDCFLGNNQRSSAHEKELAAATVVLINSQLS